MAAETAGSLCNQQYKSTRTANSYSIFLTFIGRIRPPATVVVCWIRTMQHDQHKFAYTIKEFMALAGVGRSFVYEEIAEGRLNAVKAGRKTLIREEDARAWLGALPAMKSHSSRAFERRRMAMTSTHDPKHKAAKETN